MTKLLGSIRGHRFSTFFHLGALIHHIFVLYYMNFMIDVGNHIHKYQYIRVMAEFSFRFFTCWNFLMQCCYFSLCLAHDLLQMTDSDVFLKTKENVVRLRNFMFRAFAFPMAFTVSVMFWGLFSVDRSFVFPTEAELVVPSWCNHAIHTNIAILMLVEIATTCHGYSHPESRRTAIFGLTVLSTLYFSCYIGTYIQHGIWLYPVYEILNWSQRFLFLIFSYVLTVALYLCGEGLSIKIWDNEVQDVSSQKRKMQ